MSIEAKQKIRFWVEIVLAVLVIMSTAINFAVSNAQLKFDLDLIKREIVSIKKSVSNLDTTSNTHLRIAEYKIAQFDLLLKDFDDVKSRVKSLESK